MSTGIEWTDETWNPTTGCDRVSPGCDHCYAATMAARLKGMGQPKYQRDGDPRTSGPGFGLTEHPDVLDQPLRWRKPRRVFVNSMSDLFHPRVTDEFIARVWAVMAATPQHTYQVLTKRPKRMRTWVTYWGSTWREGVMDPLPNVWLGTSVEDQQRADQRIPALLDTPAAVRFLSCEPLLGPVRLDEIRAADGVHYMPLTGTSEPEPRMHWVIVGGESGPGARPMHPAWARDLRDQCTDAGVPFLFKQWGAWAYTGSTPGGTAPPHLFEDGTVVWRVGKKAAGRELDGRTWDEFPEPAEVSA
jgi:protein gp37